MKEEYNIDNHIIKIDVQATINFYLTQNRISDDCTCDDCSYFYHEFIHKPFSIFDSLKKFGVDLGKNLKSESTGVWCVRKSNDEVAYIFQVYQVIGHFANTLSSLICPSKEQNFAPFDVICNHVGMEYKDF